MSGNNDDAPRTASPPVAVPPRDLLTSLAGVAGNMMEWYDFSVFGFFSDVIGEVFFPPDQEGHAALVQSFAVFGAAFLVRPIGGAIIGQMGDTVGRKFALETSLLLMAVPTFLMGCLPTYAVAGYGATALLVLCRLLQGLSVGGQLMSSVVFTLERTHSSRWGIWGSAVFAAASCGVVVGSLLSYILRANLTQDQLESFGWRIPCLLGILGILPGYYLKMHAKEHTPIPEPEGVAVGIGESAEGPSPRQKSVLAESFSKGNRRALLAATLVPAMPAATYYIVFIWMAIFMETIVDPPVPHAFAISSAVGVLGIFGTALGGWIADCYGRYVHIMVLSAICLAVSCPALLYVIGRGNPVTAFFCQLALGMFLAIWNGAMMPWMVASFPPSVRLTSVSIGYNLAVSVFGGFAPTFATLLVDRFNNSSPGYMVSFLAALSVVGLLIAPKSDREQETSGLSLAPVGNRIGFTDENDVGGGSAEIC